VDDPFAASAPAQALLEPLVPGLVVKVEDLPDLRALAHEVSAIATALTGEAALPAPTELNRLARRSPGWRELVVVDRALRSQTRWGDSPAASQVARLVIDELGRLDPARLKMCARPECTLLFYDSTRPNSQRWHLQETCGWRERQRRHRTQVRSGKP
jgi:predicted RNA-binding Zn ribbon-like protein